MKLINFKVTDFKSIEDSGIIDVDAITCIVGKNESGKTSLLEALTKLHSLSGLNSTFELEDYPRNKLNAYKKVHGETPAIAITAEFEFSDDEQKALESKFGKGILQSKTLRVTKDYNNELRVGLQTSEAAYATFLVNAEADLGEFKSSLKTRSLADLKESLASIADPNNAIAKLKNKVAALKEGALFQMVWEEVNVKFLPKFFYFDEYSTLPGTIDLTRLKRVLAKEIKKEEKDETSLALIRLVGASIDEFLQPENFERLTADLEAASNAITDSVFQYWTQNKQLEVEFKLEHKGANILLHTRIKNTKHRVSVPFDKRSKGFVWFFSFLVAFSDYKNAEQDVILLLDEPGLNLHAKAQGDLLRFIDDELAPHHQVVYTTHSPFMVEPHKWERIRTVEDTETKGTKVSNDPLETDADTLFPLQAALGYDIAQTLFVSPNNLLVEGPSDLIYLNVASEQAQMSGKGGLSGKWSIVPVGGADKISTFVSLLKGSKLNIAAFIDVSTDNKQRIDNMLKNKLLKKSNLFTAGMLLERTNADIEDLFAAEAYLALVNDAYKAELKTPLTIADIKGSEPRIVKRVETYFKQNNIAQGHFNHFRPANALLRNPELQKLLIDVSAQAHFALLFEGLNALI